MYLNIVSDLNPSVLNCNELLLKGKRKLKVPGYKCFNVNREDGNGGGVGICVANRDSNHVLKLLQGKKNELLVTRHDQFQKAINLINIYGEQECRNNKEVIEDNWNEVLTILAEIKAAGESSIVLGDLNKHCGSIIKDNHGKVTPGGKLIRDR